jgi:hypothetical protein
MAKMIYRKDSGEILGVHIFGLHAADLIHEASNAVATRQTVNVRARGRRPRPAAPRTPRATSAELCLGVRAMWRAVCELCSVRGAAPRAGMQAYAFHACERMLPAGVVGGAFSYVKQPFFTRR